MNRKHTRRAAGLMAALALAAAPAQALSFDALREQLCTRWNICLGEVQKPSVPEVEIPETPGISVPDAGTSTDAHAAEVVRLVNAERAKAGLSALRMDAGVTAAAQVRAREIVSTFSHTRPDGRKCFTALEEAGVRYRGAGENIAYGQPSAAAVVNAWMNSPGHRANILNANFTTIGVGHHTVGSTHYWTQLFTS